MRPLKIKACLIFVTVSHGTDEIDLVAVDRVHRIGQEKTVYVTHFIVSASSPRMGFLLYE